MHIDQSTIAILFMLIRPHLQGHTVQELGEVGVPLCPIRTVAQVGLIEVKEMPDALLLESSPCCSKAQTETINLFLG
jgi:hypothetical protein